MTQYILNQNKFLGYQVYNRSLQPLARIRRINGDPSDETTKTEAPWHGKILSLNGQKPQGQGIGLNFADLPQNVNISISKKISERDVKQWTEKQKIHVVRMYTRFYIYNTICRYPLTAKSVVLKLAFNSFQFTAIRDREHLFRVM